MAGLRRIQAGVRHAGSASEAMAPAVGDATAAVLLTEVGDPRGYPSARAYVKAFGLNLKEKSSGKYQGRLRITKNGSGCARQYLWLAIFRWRKKDPIVQAWYADKVKRDGGSKARAVVALMRKLAKACSTWREVRPWTPENFSTSDV